MRSKNTFGSILAQQKGIGAGFDYMRIGLAIAIFLAHIASIGDTRGILPSTVDLIRGIFNHAAVAQESAPVIKSVAPATTNAVDMGLSKAGLSKPIVLSHVPMFFILSGFLVAGSAYRVKKVKSFLALRVLRIFPALCVEVILSAILIGAYVSTLPADKYFFDRQFFTYFGNILGFVQMTLPGVIWPNSGESTAVNANLWTLPGEFYCYLLLSIGMGSAVVFNKKVCATLFLITTVAFIVANLFFGYHRKSGVLANDLNVYYFFVGIIFFHWKDYIPRNSAIFISSIIATYFLIDQPWGVYLTPIPLAYATIFIGLTEFPSVKFLRSGDYSYGVYLYGFPISQMMLYEFPQLKGHYFALMIPSLAVTMVFAYFSWHLIEKHFLKLKRYFTTPSTRSTEKPHTATSAQHSTTPTN